MTRDLVLRLGLAGQLRFVEREIRGPPHDSVGMQDVALAKEQQIAWHQFGGRNFDGLPVAQDSRPWRNGASEFLERAA